MDDKVVKTCPGSGHAAEDTPRINGTTHSDSSIAEVNNSKVKLEINGDSSSADQLITTATDNDSADSMSMSMYELVRTDIVTCPDCKEIYSYPCLLPCLHSLCGKCIDKLHQPDSNKDGDGSSEKTVSASCPICESSHPIPLGGFPCNHFLLNLVEIYQLQNDDERPCAYCQYDRETQAATVRCVECQDDLCESCGLAHKKTKLTRNHVLAPFEQIQLGKYDLDIRSKQQVNCNIHSTELCSSFCVTCNQLYCENCDKDHDKHTILKNVEFSSLNDKDRRGSSMSCLIDTINDRLPFYKSYLQFLTGYQERLKQNREEAVEAINKRAELLHQLIEKQKTSMLETLETRISETDTQISEDLNTVKKATASYTSNLEFIDYLQKYAKPIERLDLERSVEERLAFISQVSTHTISEELQISLNNKTSDDECTPIVDSLLGDIRLGKRTPDLDLHNISGLKISYPSQRGGDNEPTGRANQGLNLRSHNYPSTQIFTPELLPQPELVLEFNSSLPTDGNNTWPTGVCVTVIGDIVICDRDNACVKLFSSTGKHKSTLQGELDYKLEKPFDVALISSTGELVVSDYGTESVKIFSTSGIGRLIISGEFEYPRGVATTKDDYILVLDSELGRVTVHNPGDGKILKTIQGDSPTTSMIDPYYLCLSVYGDIIITDFAEPNIKIISPESDEVTVNGEYGVIKPQGLLQPYGCCQDNYGMTLIADNRNDKISVMLPSGHFEKHLITKRQGLWQPIAVCLDVSGNLIVTEGLGKVKIFRYV